MSRIAQQDCLISFGANLGNPADTIRQAAKLLQQQLQLDDTNFRLSRLFGTPPVGGPVGQPPFVNAVAALRTTANPWSVWQHIREIELTLGRRRNQRWEARAIDLDILLFDHARIWSPQLKIPHPRMAMRRFILVPALDVAERWIDPVSQLSITDLASRLQARPASVLVVGQRSAGIERLALDAARKAMAEWVDPLISTEQSVRGAPEPLETDAPVIEVFQLKRGVDRQPGLSHGRWIGFLPSEMLNESRLLLTEQRPKLTMVIAPPMAQEGAAWEDLYRSMAERMELSDPPRSDGACAKWPIDGPRYLLAGDDLQWAEHEIVSALEAMDCPIEPIVEV